MPEKYEIAIVGAGPGGLSAAAHAASLGIPHILLEKSSAVADTIQKYQKGKHVMAEPGILPLRSEVPFAQGTREDILSGWEGSVEKCAVNICYDSEVASISGKSGSFEIALADGKKVEAAHIILGIGVQGNLRKLGIEGEVPDFVEYQLDDPLAILDEEIVVVGAGDAAIENAVALSVQNHVTIINRKDEFARAKDGNVALINEAIESGSISCLYNAVPIEISPAGPAPTRNVKLTTSDGETSVPAHRVIARLGAIPQRSLVESFGVEFPNRDPTSLPLLSTRYESSVEGLYVIGALAGYPLIKQAMNQGYEAVEYILGRDIQPADHDLLAKKFEVLEVEQTVDEVLAAMQEQIPLFKEVNALMFREIILDSVVHAPEPGSVIFSKNDYTNSFYSIFAGEVEVEVGNGPGIISGAGNFFGELSLLSGRRRSATILAGQDCVLVETPRKTMNKLLSSVASAKKVLDETFILRTIQARFAPETTLSDLQPIASSVVMKEFQAGEIIFNEGDEADALHLIRSGSVSVLKKYGSRELPMAYVSAGNYVGEMGLLGGYKRSATVRATVKTQTISLDAENFNHLLEMNAGLKESLADVVKGRLQENLSNQSSEEAGDVLEFLLQQGLGEATDVLLIDKALCVNCDNCEVACAETHDGTSRLNRQGGAIFAEVHVPTSCRHCEDPHCMTDCPPDAIQRAPGGEVFIGDNCIGCGNCERNCPYDVIQMAYPSTTKKNFWSDLLFGALFTSGANSEGKSLAATTAPDPIKQAVKCDMCKDLAGGPACVRACPTGAANRLSPEQFVNLVTDKRS